MKPSIFIQVAFCMVGTVFLSTANAEVISYYFEAQRTSIFAFDGFDPGSDAETAAGFETLEGIFSYDTDAGVIHEIAGVRRDYAGGDSGLDEFEFAADYIYNTRIINSASDSVQLFGHGENLVADDFIVFSFNDPSGTVLSSTDIPTELSLQDFPNATLRFADLRPPLRSGQVNFDITSLVKIPSDSDEDGVVDAADFCPGTTIPEVAPTTGKLGNGRYALMEAGSGIFSMGEATRTPYSTADTEGCSCTQIVAVLGLGDGHLKYGCSIGVMGVWVQMLRE